MGAWEDGRRRERRYAWESRAGLMRWLICMNRLRSRSRRFFVGCVCGCMPRLEAWLRVQSRLSPIARGGRLQCMVQLGCRVHSGQHVQWMRTVCRRRDKSHFQRLGGSKEVDPKLGHQDQRTDPRNANGTYLCHIREGVITRSLLMLLRLLSLGLLRLLLLGLLRGSRANVVAIAATGGGLRRGVLF